jgi:hypothetical protein
MDWMAFWTVVIALVASFGEMISKHESKVIGDIFNRYLLLYLGINAVFAFATYHFLPSIAQFFLKPEQLAWATGSTWSRVFVAAFGYMVIVRAKVLTIKDTPIGVDTLYDTFARYCLRHTSVLINNRQNDILENVIQRFRDLGRYQIALEDRLASAPEGERETIRAQKENILASSLPAHVKCKRLGELILRIVSTRAELEKALERVPEAAVLALIF